ncbi:flagellar protein FlgN [Tropicibacter naphthalenivorans]|uniref:FlgN protein n=1 Tax=Tropicibacter naphthalenivorans TaxID=441103 RepID=A0A0P1GDN3_9RHOB|nr:flagellar protein FlgN [Tropicibacter naphthalenivorans]CUH79733.1 FlgN protein [Tropicibacter naphthalenivorans]SMC74832.1 hypothetical protein SAMN04488093_103249 [Tropicibacter naphthalenivorans]
MTSDTTRRLEELLKAERQALLSGDFDQIAEIMEEKQKIAEDLDEAGLSSEELSPIRDGMRRNQELFDQALAGLRNVTNRISDLNRVRRSTDTYDAQGRRQTIDAPADRRLERRA